MNIENLTKEQIKQLAKVECHEAIISCDNCVICKCRRKNYEMSVEKYSKLLPKYGKK